MNIKQEREAFKKHYGALFDLTETPDAWGNPRFAHEFVEAIWYGWRDRAALQSQDREDAERYRWLRDGGNDDIGVVRGFDCIDSGSTTVVGTYEEALDGEQLDAAIDAARAAKGEA